MYITPQHMYEGTYPYFVQKEQPTFQHQLFWMISMETLSSTTKGFFFALDLKVSAYCSLEVLDFNGNRILIVPDDFVMFYIQIIDVRN